MSWLDLLKVQQDGVDVGSVSRIVLNLKSGPPVTSNDATGAYDIDFAAWLASINVTATTDGTVNLFGATPNTVLQSDGSTAGGVWRSYLALGTTPPTTGRVRLTDGDALVWDDGYAHDISCLSESGGYVTVGAVDANVVGVLLRAGAGGGADAFVGIRTNNVNRLIIGDTGVNFPSAAPVTFTGNPTVDGGMGQWWVDKIDVGTAIGVGLGTLPASGYIRLDNSGTMKWRSAGGGGADEFALEVAGATLKLGPASTSGSTLALRGQHVTISAGAAGTITIPQAASVAFSGNPTVDGGTAQWSLDLLDVDSALTIDAAAHIDIADASTWMATTGDIRCGRTFSLTARNGANSADHALIDYTSNYLTIGSYDAADRVYYLMLRGHTYAQLSAAGKNVTLGSSGLTSTGDWLFASSMAAPKIYQETDSTADVEADDLTVYAQGVSAAGGTHAHAGNLGLRGGIASGNAANTDGNVWFHASPGALANWQGMENGMFIADRVAAPSGNPANGGFFYSEGGALYWRGSSGTVTCIAPA
jgi:hypothetical protein